MIIINPALLDPMQDHHNTWTPHPRTPSEVAVMQVLLYGANFVTREVDFHEQPQDLLGRGPADLLWFTIPTSCSYNIGLPKPAHITLTSCSCDLPINVEYSRLIRTIKRQSFLWLRIVIWYIFFYRKPRPHQRWSRSDWTNSILVTPSKVRGRSKENTVTLISIALQLKCVPQPS